MSTNYQKMSRKYKKMPRKMLGKYLEITRKLVDPQGSQGTTIITRTLLENYQKIREELEEILKENVQKYMLEKEKASKWEARTGGLGQIRKNKMIV